MTTETNFRSALPNKGRAPKTVHRIYAFYRLGAAAAFILAGYMMWDALHYQQYWLSDAAGYTSLALSLASMILAVCAEFCKPVYYRVQDLPMYDWPFAETLIVNHNSGEVIGNRDTALTTALKASSGYGAWRNLRPTVTMFALMSAVGACVVLIANIGM